MNRGWLTQGALAAGLMLASQVCGATSIVRPNTPVTVEQSARNALGADSAPNDSANSGRRDRRNSSPAARHTG